MVLKVTLKNVIVFPDPNELDAHQLHIVAAKRIKTAVNEVDADMFVKLYFDHVEVELVDDGDE